MVVFVLRHELRQDSPPQELEAPLVNNYNPTGASHWYHYNGFLVEKEFKRVGQKQQSYIPFFAVLS